MSREKPIGKEGALRLWEDLKAAGEARKRRQSLESFGPVLLRTALCHAKRLGLK